MKAKVSAEPATWRNVKVVYVPVYKAAADRRISYVILNLVIINSSTRTSMNLLWFVW